MITDEERRMIEADATEADVAGLVATVESLESQAEDAQERLALARQALLARKPLLERLIFAAHTRCDCGAGMAYDPTSQGDGVFKGPSKWECSAILRKDDLTPEELVAALAARHTSPLPFAFYEVKSERQPSAGGATTRPQAVEA